jgi:CheY-like chemotaxis protein
VGTNGDGATNAQYGITQTSSLKSSKSIVARNKIIPTMSSSSRNLRHSWDSKNTLVLEERRFLVFEVEDSGIGVSEEKKDSLYIPRQQASRLNGGTGLGLVISKKLLQLLDSDIELESEIGKGSNFNFILSVPCVSDQSNVNNDILYHDYIEENLDGLRVLLVEDNLINVKVAEKILSQWNVQVEVALNGLIATQMYESGKYDIILMDLAMPVMDGYEATRAIRARNGPEAQIPVIALTADAREGARLEAANSGMSDFLTKPIIVSQLAAALENWGAQAETARMDVSRRA